jgi:hypothetical protein
VKRFQGPQSESSLVAYTYIYTRNIVPGYSVPRFMATVDRRLTTGICVELLDDGVPMNVEESNGDIR